MEGKRPVNWILCIAIVLLFLVLVSAHFSSGLLARYTTSASGSDSARVAVFAVTVTDGQDSQMIQQGFTLSMDPTVTAAQCASVIIENASEVAVLCTVSIESTGNLPLDFFLKSEGNVVESIQMGPGDTAPALEIWAAWQDTAGDNDTYHREVDHITVTLHFTQID